MQCLSGTFSKATQAETPCSLNFKIVDGCGCNDLPGSGSKDAACQQLMGRKQDDKWQPENITSPSSSSQSEEPETPSSCKLQGSGSGDSHTGELKECARTRLEQPKHSSLGRYKRFSAVTIVPFQCIFLPC